MKLPVQEIFGPTIQGEGTLLGLKTLFVRLAGCDYSCAWCDSKFTWQKETLGLITYMEPSAIVSALERIRCGSRHVSVSGGNPALHNLSELLDLLHDHQYLINLETQGSLVPSWLPKLDSVTISPKPPSSGMTPDWAVLRQCVAASNRAYLKVVVFDETDYEYARKVHLQFPGVELSLQVGNRVGEDGVESLLRGLLRLTEKVTADPTMAQVRVLPQLHVLLWGNQRGV